MWNAETTEAEAEKEKEKKAVARTVKAVAETDTRETAPHVHQSRCKHRSSKREASGDKMQCTFPEKQQRNDKE